MGLPVIVLTATILWSFHNLINISGAINSGLCWAFLGSKERQDSSSPGEPAQKQKLTVQFNKCWGKKMIKKLLLIFHIFLKTFKTQQTATKNTLEQGRPILVSPFSFLKHSSAFWVRKGDGSRLAGVENR